MTFRCTMCGQPHAELPDIGVDRPDQWWAIPEHERDTRIQLTPDTCIIDNKDYFIRGVIEIPIHNHAATFGLGVWVSQKRENFLLYQQNRAAAEIGPFFGWLCTRLAYYAADMLFLKTQAHFRGRDLRPLIAVEPTDHPLAIDQQAGMSLAKAWEVVHYYQAFE